MARYIKEYNVYEKLRCYFHLSPRDCEQLLTEIPTEDVVPISEVEKLKKLNNQLEIDIVNANMNLDHIIQEIDQIQKDKAEVIYLKEQLIAKAKQEVARELIDDIADFIWQSRGESFCLLIDGTFYGKEEMKEYLRKKYIGE